MAVHRIGVCTDVAESGEFEKEEVCGENWGKIGFEEEEEAGGENIDGEEEKKEEEEEEYVVRKEGFPMDYTGL